MTGNHEKTEQVPTTHGDGAFDWTMGGYFSGAGSAAGFAAASSTQVRSTAKQQEREG